MKSIKTKLQLIKRLLFILSLALLGAWASAQDMDHLDIHFEKAAANFTETEKQLAVELLTDSEGEVWALPKGADYQTWMFQHPDGRTSIGYRTGNYLIKKALSNSGKTILEVSRLSPGELWALAGY